MTDKIDFEALGRRAAACKHWRWLAGMATDVGERVPDDDDPYGCVVDSDDPEDKPIPDLRDPATLGCLLALVREAWGRSVFAACDRGDELWRVYQAHREYVVGQGRSEAAALVAALEAAPR